MRLDGRRGVCKLTGVQLSAHMLMLLAMAARRPCDMGDILLAAASTVPIPGFMLESVCSFVPSRSLQQPDLK